MTRRPDPGIADYCAVGLVSAAALAYEILLLEVFSYSQWHHFASLAVALALLGFGAAGTVLTLLGDRVIRWGDRLFYFGILVGVGGMIAAFLFPQVVIVRPLFAAWDVQELGKLLLIDFVSFVPFFGLALCIGQVFIRWPTQTPRLYSANLLGSGIGSLLASLLLSISFLEYALMTIPLLTLVGGAALGFSGKRWPFMGVVSLAGVVVMGTWLLIGLPQLPVSDFKRLSYLLDLPDSQILEETPGLHSKTTLVRSDSIRTSPGLSLQWTETIPSQDALVLGSDRSIPVPRPESIDRGSFEYLDATLGAVPFFLRREGPVSILGTSSWHGVYRTFGREATWVEVNPQVVETFVSRGLPSSLTPWTGNVRQFLRTTEQTYSIIFQESSVLEGDAASEEYTLTVDALNEALRRLDSGGILAIPLKLNNPPRYFPKMLKMGVKAMKQTGVNAPEKNTAILRSMQEVLIIISNRELSEQDIGTIREVSEELGFNIVAMPGLQKKDSNRYHDISGTPLYETARALLTGEGEVPDEASWYSLEAATDQKPYFWHSMLWKRLPELIGEYGRQGLVWLDWAVLTLVAKLLLASVLAAVLILLPLGRLPSAKEGYISRSRVLVYFTSLGLGFLLMEMAVFQRSIYYLGHPVLAASLVFSVFLIGSGIGSLSVSSGGHGGIQRRIFIPVLLGGALAFAILWNGEALVWSLTDWARFAVLGLAVLPLSWSLGRPMPWGLRRLDSARPLIPWAWGINGFASVLAAPLASLISIHSGQYLTWICAGLCYLVAWRVAW